MLGKSIIITDNPDWTTAEIVQAHLDRWQVEHGFRQSKHPLLVGVQSIRHWTDSKIRCHLSTCVVALTHLRRLGENPARSVCLVEVGPDYGSRAEGRWPEGKMAALVLSLSLRHHILHTVPYAEKTDGRRFLHTNAHEGLGSLTDLVDGYEASGPYALTREQALVALQVSGEALKKKAVRRLVDKRRLAVPRRSFYVIVPLEYREAGAPPASWFIDELMAFHGQPYYVGVLSAATIYGAAHHQPQEFQVVTSKQLRPVAVGRARIRFHRTRTVDRTPTVEVKTETGVMRVSTPEATAFDLLRYLDVAGHLGNVATVLTELAERLDPQRLGEVARAEAELAIVQRLGYLLAQVDEAYAATLGDHSVTAGDMLIAGFGDERHPVGRACAGPDGIGPATVKADCFRVRLDLERRKHVALISKIREAIDRLKELRAALISAAVTGRIDVREEVPG